MQHEGVHVTYPAWVEQAVDWEQRSTDTDKMGVAIRSHDGTSNKARESRLERRSFVVTRANSLGSACRKLCDTRIPCCMRKSWLS